MNELREAQAYITPQQRALADRSGLLVFMLLLLFLRWDTRRQLRLRYRPKPARHGRWKARLQ